MFRYLALCLLIVLPAEAFAQGLGVGSNFSTQSYSGRLSGQNKAPIPLSQILSGSTSGTVATTPSYSSYQSPSYQSYNNGASTSGVPYSFSMHPTDVARNRAQRDAIAQNKQIDTLAYLKSDALTQTYAEEYAKYQEELGIQKKKEEKSNSILPFGAKKEKPEVRRNTKVRYKRTNKIKMTKPKRIFSSNY